VIVLQLIIASLHARGREMKRTVMGQQGLMSVRYNWVSWQSYFGYKFYSRIC